MATRCNYNTGARLEFAAITWINFLRGWYWLSACVDCATAKAFGMRIPILCSSLPMIALFVTGCTTVSPRSDVRLNQIQVIGSHNSYHQRAHESLHTLLARRNPEAAKALDYSHPPLTDQFERLGIRQIELDCLADPRGGLYAHPKGIEWASQAGLPAVPDQDPSGELLSPGIKVLHVPDIDYQSSVPTLVDGLKEILAWSDQHPKHVPIFVLLELKNSAESPELTQPVPFDEGGLAELEAEIRSVIPREKILAPDDVRRGEPSLPAGLKKFGWPNLDAVRGRIMFGLDNEGPVRDLYLKGHPALQHRLLFVSVPETNPAAAWMKINDPIANFDRIQKLVRAGFLVRTRADSDTEQSRNNDPTQREKAMTSGAQFISTDYREPNRQFSDYSVHFENDEVARVNPVNGDPSLRGLDLEKAKK